MTRWFFPQRITCLPLVVYILSPKYRTFFHSSHTTYGPRCAVYDRIDECLAVSSLRTLCLLEQIQYKASGMNKWFVSSSTCAYVLESRCRGSAHERHSPRARRTVRLPSPPPRMLLGRAAQRGLPENAREEQVVRTARRRRRRPKPRPPRRPGPELWT